MLAAKTTLEHAQTVKEYLVKHNLMHQGFLTVKEFNFIYFAIVKKAKVPNATILNTKFDFPQKRNNPTPEELLQKSLTKKERELIPKTQEIIGTIMILEIPPELQKKETIIAEAYLKTNKSIKTVVKKEDIHTGEFRTRKVKVLAGYNTTETTHLESGVRIKLNIDQVYFSARSGHERLRIANQVKAKEKVLVLFAGCAPFPLVIAKHAKPKKIVAIELNPIACKYAEQNIELNKMHNTITLICADAKIQTPKLKDKFDRIVMPLPKTGEEFLPIALPTVKKGGIIHLYAFLQEKEFTTYRKKIRDLTKKMKYHIKILKTVKCGQFGPGIFRVCLDIKVN